MLPEELIVLSKLKGCGPVSCLCPTPQSLLHTSVLLCTRGDFDAALAVKHVFDQAAELQLKTVLLGYLCSGCCTLGDGAKCNVSSEHEQHTCPQCLLLLRQIEIGIASTGSLAAASPKAMYDGEKQCTCLLCWSCQKRSTPYWSCSNIE